MREHLVKTSRPQGASPRAVIAIRIDEIASEDFVGKGRVLKAPPRKALHGLLAAILRRNCAIDIELVTDIQSQLLLWDKLVPVPGLCMDMHGTCVHLPAASRCAEAS